MNTIHLVLIWVERHIDLTIARQCVLALALACATQSLIGCANAPLRNYGRSDASHASSPASAEAEHGERRAEPAPAEAPADADADAPLRERSATSLLAVPGFETAVVVTPGGDGAAPLLVATHGAGGDPEWECERWARVAKGRWFLLCPRGTALRRGEGSYYYADHLKLEREVMAAVGAARSTYGARIAKEHGVYLGYSQGATMGALMVVEHGTLFPHLVLIEGGSGDWTRQRAARFRETGGQSVYIGCGTPSCARGAARSATALERAGLHTKTEHAEGGGHTELGPVGDLAEKWVETLAVER
jgi:predicted esterase